MVATTVGELRDRVTLQVKSTAPDGQGGRAVTWGALATVWAAVVPLSARERLAAAAIGAQQLYTVVIRYRDDVVPSMRLTWTPYRLAAKTFEIHGVQPHGAGGRAFLRLDCSEVI